MENSRIIVPFEPSLQHMATVQVAVDLYNAFCIEALDEAYRRIKLDISLSSEDGKDFPGCNAAQMNLLLIPPPLRKRVIEAVHGLESGVQQWKEHHSTILEIDDEECILYWRCDGTVDTVQTAKQLVLNSNVDIKKRFYLACMYCFEDNIKTLWAEIESTGETKNLETDRYRSVEFWVGWLRDRRQEDWVQVFKLHFRVGSPLPIRFSVILPGLRVQERFPYLYIIDCAIQDDLRLCLLQMTSEEEKEAIRRTPLAMLRCYLHWPMRSMFIEMAEKMLPYFNDIRYDNMLGDLFSLKVNREVFDFPHFFDCFWNVTPSHLREIAIESSEHRDEIEAIFKEINSKRKFDVGELKSQKTKII